ncbi:MAG: hypothetical protein AAB465_00240 [Patescibacteria group bacterium]
MDNNKINIDTSSCCKAKTFRTGMGAGLFYALLPHSGCLLFIIFTTLGITAFSAILKSLLTNYLFFYSLIIVSLVLTTLAALIYLKRKHILSLSGLRNSWKYLATLYGTSILINLFLIYAAFPYVANLKFNYFSKNALAKTENISRSKMTIEVDIPCSGHAFLISSELKGLSGVQDVGFEAPNLFDVYYDHSKISEKNILSLDIFKSFKAKIL